MRQIRRALRLAAVLVLGACAAPASDGRVVETTPDRDTFAVVAQVLVRHCGTLDCHGDAARNLRLYGNEGLRWDAHDRALMPPCSTPDEVAQDYTSVVGLEPEALSAVVTDGGARPERLSLLRKPLGLEAHDGGTVFKAGSDADVCLSSWLASQTDREACLRALPPSRCF